MVFSCASGACNICYTFSHFHNNLILVKKYFSSIRVFITVLHCFFYKFHALFNFFKAIKIVVILCLFFKYLRKVLQYFSVRELLIFLLCFVIYNFF
jgi:hypothetical protein